MEASSDTLRTNAHGRWSPPWNHLRRRHESAANKRAPDAEAPSPAGSSCVCLLITTILGLWNATAAHAQYVQRQVVTTHGAVTFIGNSLGLNKDGTNDEPGTSGSIGTFITTNTNLRDNFAWPPGTTEDWRQNSSAAILNLPPNSRVVYAELIWGGSYLFGGVDVRPFLDDPVEFRTPAGLSQVTPAVATRFTRSGPEDNYYGRTANVTALVTAGGNGTYTVGRVPATQGASEADFNAAGWTLAVLYENSTLPARNLSLFVGLERAGGSAASVAGFLHAHDRRRARPRGGECDRRGYARRPAIACGSVPTIRSPSTRTATAWPDRTTRSPTSSPRRSTATTACW